MGKDDMDKNIGSQEDSEGVASEPAMEDINSDFKNSQEYEESQDNQAGDKEKSEKSFEELKKDETGKPAEEKSKTSFFNRNKKAKEDEKDEKIADLNDRLVRKAAEFDNFRKRSEKEKSQMYEIGAIGVIESILPVIDNFERGFDTLEEEDKSDAFVEGMEKVYKQLITCLEEIGVKPIEAVGQEFDPNFHNAVMHEEDSEQDNNIIIEEFQKGYTYKNNVVRYSMVKVVN